MHVPPPTLEAIVPWFQQLQSQICDGLEALDGKETLKEDPWQREAGGGGLSRVILEGAIFEKGGVNFSHVHGPMPEAITQKLQLPQGAHFDAAGVSIVIHPRSPKVPIIHMNVRYFQMEDGTYWFGGGIDLTPIYVVEADARFFHQQLKATCDRFDPTYYPRFKKWCDEYFYLKHRKEMRGVGGIFFDHLKGDDIHGKAQVWAFVRAVGETFLPAYTELVNRHQAQPFTAAEQEFQYLRRSRYVEFNLVYDRGTKFGLDTDGRTESI